MMNISFLRRGLAILLCLSISTTAGAQDRPKLTVFAAASLGQALQAVVVPFPADVTLSFGGSGAIARQVDQGAPADVVVLANPVWMTWLETRDRIRPGTMHTPFGNALALVGPPGAPALGELTRGAVLDRLGPNGRLAMGAHLSVPAGQYGKTWLEQEGLWDALLPRLAEVENVRAAFALVARAEVPLAIVYRSDLVAAPDAVSLVWEIPQNRQPTIRYAVAAVTEKGEALAAFLAAPDSLAVFERFGFSRGTP